MNRQKNLFDLFRDSQHDLDERPGLQSWRRLERRLDAHQQRGRVSLYRSLGMVAGVLVLVAMIILLSLVIDQQREFLTGTPQQLEELPSSDSDATAYKIVEFTRTYQDRMSNPIEEGNATKKLVPAVHEN